MRSSDIAKVIVVAATLPLLVIMAKVIYDSDVEAGRSPLQSVGVFVGALIVFRVVEAYTVLPVFSLAWYWICLYVGLVVDVCWDLPRRLLRTLLEPMCWRHLGSDHELQGVQLRGDGGVRLPDGVTVSASECIIVTDAGVFAFSGKTVYGSMSNGEQLSGRYGPDGWYLRES